MARIEQSVEIARPPAEVFAVLADPTRLAEWQGTVVEAELEGEEPMRAGTRVREVRSFLGKRIESTVEILEHEPPTRFALRSAAGPVTFRVEQTVEPVATGSRVRVQMEGEARGVLGLGARVAVKAAERQLRTDLDTLKRLLEGRG
jgi:carbon monoxide dehydrogenase subunit G